MNSLSSKYQIRFSRNLGIISNQDQDKLQQTKVGVAGLGGLGGQTLINLTRMGIGSFHIADLDEFDYPNTNRQIGAAQSTIGLTKVEVMQKMALDINPELKIVTFKEGITSQSIDDFVCSCDVIVDSLDFFCLNARRILYTACEKYRKTVILSAPLGFSATLHAFSPTSMSVNEYFGWKENMDKYEQMIHFAVGIAPCSLHLRYLKFDKKRIVETGTGPSISNACTLGASLLANEVLMTIVKKRPLYEAPYYTQFDLYLGKYQRKKLLWGNRGPYQKLKIYFAKKEFNEIKSDLLKIIK